MGMPRLEFGKEMLPMKEIGPKHFKLFRPSDLLALSNSDKIFPRKIQVVAICDPDSFENIHSQVQKRLCGADYFLAVVMIGEESDSILDQFGKIKRPGKDSIFFITPEDPIRSAFTLSESLSRSDEFPMMIDCRSVRDQHPLNSFSTVVTKEIWPEAAIMIETVRLFHHQPIFIVCDEESKNCLSGIAPDLVFEVKDIEKAKEITSDFYLEEKKKANRFHRPDAILWKMDALERGIQETGSSFFVDADILALKSLSEPFSESLCLSPHHGDRKPTAGQYGVFNAGYLFSSDLEVPNLWRELYLNRSKFYEQEGMIHLLQSREVQTFGPDHNFGHWRGELEIGLDVKSFHAHMTTCLDHKADPRLLQKHLDLRDQVKKYCRENSPQVLEIIKRHENDIQTTKR